MGKFPGAHITVPGTNCSAIHGGKKSALKAAVLLETQYWYFSIMYANTKSLMTGPHARRKMLTITFLVSINLAHNNITIDVSTQKSLLHVTVASTM